MTTTLQIQTGQIITSKTARAIVLIDFGNGDVKAMAQLPGAEPWVKCKFPSHVAISPTANSDCLRLVTENGDQDYLVGQLAADIQCSRTGRTADGKVKNARALLLYAVGQLLGFSPTPLHIDCIFTSPSVKSYAPQIIPTIQKSHWVRVPADAEVIGSTERECVVHVHTAIPQLEGYQAFAGVQSKVKGSAYLCDVGSRTILLTQVSETGRILGRTPFDACGVYSIAQRIRDREALAAQLMTPSVQDVIDFLLDHKHGPEIAETIAPHISACVGEVLDQAKTGSQRFILGGGAKLPGMDKVLGGRVIKHPQWANLTALADVAHQLIERAV